jgi:superfamily II DNA or RNA helicase
MSRLLKQKDIQDSTKIKSINKDLTITLEPSKYGFGGERYVFLYEDGIVPFFYGSKHVERPQREMYDKIYDKITENKNSSHTSYTFSGNLREPQKEVKKEAIEILNKQGSVIISAYCGFGKSITALSIACKIKMRTLIVCHRLVLIKQWKESIERFCPSSKITVLDKGKDDGKKTLPDSEFYIINAINIPKYNPSLFSHIGLVMVDECHNIMADKLSQGMKSLFPRYLIGLSATPYRVDGLDVLLELYFGTTKIVRENTRKHLIYKVETGIKITPKLNKMGKIDWGSVIEAQASNKERNELIVNILKKFSDRTFLVICKRVEQAKYILSRLIEEKQDATSLIGSNQTYDKNSRIIVGTAQKVSTGFDSPNLDAMVLASDVEQYFVQYLGRVFRREDVVPIIFDIVDDFPLLQKHYRTRYDVYIEKGGEVKKYV